MDSGPVQYQGYPMNIIKSRSNILQKDGSNDNTTLIVNMVGKVEIDDAWVVDFCVTEHITYKLEILEME